MLCLLEEALIEVIQNGQNQDNDKLVASVKYLWVLENPLYMDLGVDYTFNRRHPKLRVNQEIPLLDFLRRPEVDIRLESV